MSNRNTLLCLLLLSWVINYCALVSFNPCPDEKRNVQPSFSPRLMFRLAPSFEGFVASLKNLQYNFPKMRGRGGVKGCLELFRKFIYFGRGRRPLHYYIHYYSLLFIIIFIILFIIILYSVTLFSHRLQALNFSPLRATSCFPILRWLHPNGIAGKQIV